jgi:hypothetical protein
VLQAARADAIGPLLILLDLLECHPYRVRYIGLAHTSMRRRMRKRLPTCLSVGFALFGICALGQWLSEAGAEGAGDGVAAKGLTVEGVAGAAPVVVGELRKGGTMAVVDIGAV